MKKNIFYNILIFVVLMIISRASIFTNDWVTIFLTLLLIIIYISTNKLYNISKLILIVFCFFIINIWAIYFFNANVSILRIINVAISIIIFPYLVLCIVGKSFWDRFERVVYILTLISLPLFLLNIIFPYFFNYLTPIMRPFTADTFISYYPFGSYWSAFIYVHGAGDVLRNHGFMWEPGAFSMIIIWAISYNWLKSGIKFDKKFFIYAIALATTLSTAGYLAIFVLILSKYIKKVNFSNLYKMILTGIVFFVFIYSLNFVGNEIESYVENYKYDINLFYNEDVGAMKVNRFRIVDYHLKSISENPIGYGVVSKKDYSNEIEVVGVNGLTSLLVMWGIPIFIYILYLLIKYIQMLNIHKYSNFTLTLFLIGFLIVVFSNPIARNPFIYLILLTPIIFEKNKGTYKND